MYTNLFDLAFIIHYVNGDTIHGIWNSNEGIHKGEKLPFHKLTELNQVSSIEIVYKDKRSGHISRSVLSIPVTDKKVRYVMLFKGMYSEGLQQVTANQIEMYVNKNGVNNPRYLSMPSAIQISVLALEVVDSIDRTPLDAYKTYPVIAKLIVDSFGIFQRRE